MGEGGHPGAGHHSATSVTICECYLNMDLISACKSTKQDPIN